MMSNKRKPTFIEAASTVVMMGLLIGIGYVGLGIRLEPLLIAAAVYSGFIAHRVGVSWREMEIVISEKVAKAMPAIMIIFVVGILIGTWMFAGTVPMMIYFGLKMISPQYFLVAAFLITAVISTATGTSWGSAGTAGVALLGVAQGLGIPLPQAVGAIVAGSVFGDKMSPLSDTTNLAALVTETNLYDHIRHMLYTTVPAAGIGCLIYLFIGFQDAGQIVIPENVKTLMDTLDVIYSWNIILLLPPAIIIYGSLTKRPVIPFMILSAVVATALGAMYQGFDIYDGIMSMVKGFNVSMIKIDGFDSENVIWDVTRLINRGGLNAMSGLVLLVLCSYAFAGIVEAAGCLEVLVAPVFKHIKSTGSLICTTVLASIAIVCVAGTSYISMVMLGALLTDTYKRMGLHTKNLSRTLEDAGTMVVPFLTWGSSGIYYTEIFGVSPFEYGIWAIPCYLGFIFAIFYGYTGIAIEKTDYNPEPSESAEISGLEVA